MVSFGGVIQSEKSHPGSVGALTNIRKGRLRQPHHYVFEINTQDDFPNDLGAWVVPG